MRSLRRLGLSFAGVSRLPDNLGQLQQQTAWAILEDPAVDNLSSFVGVDAANNTTLNSGQLLINLKPNHERQDSIMQRLRTRAQQVAGVELFLLPTQDLTIDAESGPTQYRVSVEGSNRLRSLSATCVLPPKMRARVCFITCFTRGTIASSSRRKPSSASCLPMVFARLTPSAISTAKHLAWPTTRLVEASSLP